MINLVKTTNRSRNNVAKPTKFHNNEYARIWSLTKDNSIGTSINNVFIVKYLDK